MPRVSFVRARVHGLAGWSVVVAFVLIGVALMTTVWATRAAVEEASTALRGGQALTVEHAVRADLLQAGEVPTSAELQDLLDTHAAEGLRYIALYAGSRRPLVEAGEPRGSALEDGDRGPPLAPRGVRLIGDRLRVIARVSARPGRRPGPPLARGWRVVLEVEPVQANTLRGAARLSLGIGALATASLLAVAIVLVRRESRRQADQRERERERRLASLGEMSAVLAHELRNPLASLKGNAQLLAQLLPDGEKPRAKAERVVQEAVRLERLTADLLRFVRTSELQRVEVAPAAVVRGALPPSEDGAATAVELDDSAAPAAWTLDADRVSEVVRNLVDNALDAGGPVRVAVRVAQRRLRIDVSDRGPGVPSEERERIFEPFVTTKAQGTGLGLAVARRIAELHGGTLVALDNPGGGALFRLELPEA
ncbi:MAG: ATP-binding protein [Kofleriaceae bacterium]